MTQKAVATPPKQGLLFKLLNKVEYFGNKLPNPAILFALFAFGVLILSWLASVCGLAVVSPATGQEVAPVNLLSVRGLHFILTKTVTNFTGFAPLGVVLVSMLGLGIAEYTGLISALVRGIVLYAHRRLITAAIVIAGILSHLGGDVGYLILVPLAGSIFLALGRHPIAGIAAAFAAVSGGFCANFLLGPNDPLVAGLTQEAARILLPGYEVSPACNYYFLVASAFLVVIIVTLVTEKLIEPRLGKYDGDIKGDEIKPLSKEEKRGSLWAGIFTLVLTGLILIGILPANGILRGAGGSVLHSPLMNGIITLIFILGAGAGIAYGYGAKTIKGTNDIIKGMSNSMAHMAAYIVLVFFAAQFVAYFKESNLGIIIAVEGAAFLKSMNMPPALLLISLTIMTAFINLFMGSASAKWAILAPVFVPMFMLLGYTPEATQLAYRVGDSVTNIISPMMSYMALIITYFLKYDKKSGIGTIVATMLPYSMALLLLWGVFMMIWVSLGLPIGPGAGILLPQ